MVALKIFSGLLCLAAANEIPVDPFDPTESLSLLQVKAKKAAPQSRGMTITKIHTNRRCRGDGSKRETFGSAQECADAWSGQGIKYLAYWKQNNNRKGLRGLCMGWTEAECPENRIAKIANGNKNKLFRCSEEEEAEATGDPHMTTSTDEHYDLSLLGRGDAVDLGNRGNVNCGFSADACKMECEKVGKTFGVASPRANGQAGWPGVGDYAGVGCYTYTPRMARFLGQDTANSCVYGIMDSGKHPESDAELVSTHQAWARFGPGTGARQLYVRLPNTFGNPNGVNHCEDLEEPTDPNPEDTDNEEQAEEEAKNELENEDQASATGDPHMTTNTGEHFDLSLLKTSKSSAQPQSGAMTLTKVHTNRRCRGDGIKRAKFGSAKECAEAWTGQGVAYLAFWKQSNQRASLRGLCMGWTEAQCTGKIGKLAKGNKNKLFKCSEEDEAEATGDPHMTTNTGDHYDLALP